MATYAELRALFNDSGLRNKVTSAAIIAAESALSDPVNFPTTTADVTLQTDRLLWAARVFNGAEAEGRKLFMAVLAANSSATVAAIQGASDTVIQNNVNDAVDLFAQHDKLV